MTRAARTPPLHFHTIDDVTAVLRSRGGRLSAPRRLVLRTLFETAAPMSAEAIATAVGLDLTSVYRNLEYLEELGVIRHVHFGHGPGLYALVGRDAREYLVCEACEGVTPVEPHRLSGVRDAIREEFGFEAGFSHFPILGVCSACRAAGASTSDHRHDEPHDH
ncbi:MAG: Fur family transcriptional regulator [Solirubrobacteraceae bacterium]